MSDRVLSVGAEFRALDEEKRSASFVASTENPVETWDGREVLRMSGVKLKRFRRNPVVLDSHERFSVDSVIGRAEVEVKGRELHATITYAKTDRAERAWELVRDGFVRAVSIGYAVNRDKVKRVARGEADGEGESRVEGPAVIVREWELLEVSNVPIPADAAALRRSFYDSLTASESDDPPTKNRREAPMSAVTQAMSGAIAPAPVPAPGAAAPEATPPQSAPQTRTLADTSDELRARRAEAFKREVLAITPRGLEAIAESAVLDGLDMDGVRAALRKANAERFKPLGTTEPATPPSTPAPTTVSDEDFLAGMKRAFAGRS